MKNQQRFWAFLQPSWVVNVIGVSLGLVITTVVIVGSRYAGSDLKLQVFNAHSSGQSVGAFQNATSVLSANKFIASLPLLLVWAGVGLVVYFFAISIIHSFSQAAELREELSYVHLSRQALLRQALNQLGLRALAVIGWFIFLKITTAVLLPYAVAAANIASQNLSLSSVGYALVSFVVIYVTVCIHAVFLRAVLLKLRVFN